ncbi:AI-2E family transporter [Motilimonas cestriensis]|uniref:AI-2E family transporter n=1 Tax=Motilimonas cestriensis TaxID=2742685 RepID=A0ABS8WFK7_9GAMM|nr:AI-2E family transporter [Motilimonas cestriensis]MCE2597045.1 AI-2E family transporter [Motilimonas cestriensis]
MKALNFEKHPGRVILLLALCLSAYTSYSLISPYIEPVIIALIFTMLCHPLHSWINNRLKHRENVAAALTCTLITCVILLPMFFIFLAILNQAASYSKSVLAWIQAGGIEQLVAHPWVSQVLQLAREWLPVDVFDSAKINQDLMALASSSGKQALSLSAQFAGSISSFIFSFVLMLFVLFFTLRDYHKLTDFLRHAIPLSRSQEDSLLQEIQMVSKSALLGSFLTALCQGIVGGIGFWIVGIPGLFWGTIMAFASLIPVVGTALIWVPAALFLLLTGEWQWAAFLAVWGVLVVGSIDNFLRPVLMNNISSMNTLVIFLSLMGGIHAFGLMGLIYGPIIIATTFVLFHLYETEFKEFLNYQDKH